MNIKLLFPCGIHSSELLKRDLYPQNWHVYSACWVTYFDPCPTMQPDAATRWVMHKLQKIAWSCGTAGLAMGCLGLIRFWCPFVSKKMANNAVLSQKCDCIHCLQFFCHQLSWTDKFWGHCAGRSGAYLLGVWGIGPCHSIVFFLWGFGDKHQNLLRLMCLI